MEPEGVRKKRAAARAPGDPERRGEILRAALGVFAKKGFQRATVRDVARAAGLADGTIYVHFKNKDDLLLGLLEGLSETGVAEVELGPALGESLEAFLPRHFGQVLDALTEGTGAALGVILAEMLTNEALREGYARRLLAPTLALGEQALARWTVGGSDRPAERELTVRLVSAMLLGLVVQRLLGDPVLAERWQEVPAAVSGLVLNGIRADGR